MKTIYVILHDNGYDAQELHGYDFYTSKELAESDCAKLNKAENSKHPSYSVEELDLKE